MSGLTTRKLGVVASVTVMSLVLSLSSPSVKAADKVLNDKLGGKNRVETSISIADTSWNNNWKSEDTVIIANGNSNHLVDSLTVAPLAYSEKAPILLISHADKIDEKIMDKLYTQKIKNVYIVGGVGAISKNAEKQLVDAGIKVTRLGGQTRFDTAKAINEKIGNTSIVAVVGSDAVADALSIASIASHEKMSIVLAKDKNTVDIESIKGKNVYAVGGKEILSDKLVNEMKAKRIGGSTRYETNAKVLKEFDGKLKYHSLYIANGNTLVDALSGSVLAAQGKSPIILVNDFLNEDTKKIIQAKSGSINNIIELGLGIKSNIISEMQSLIVKENNESNPTIPYNPIYDVKYVLPLETVNLKVGDKYTLPKTVKVKLMDDSIKELEVTWNEEINTSKKGVYNLTGIISGTKKNAELKIVIEELPVTVEVSVDINLITETPITVVKGKVKSNDLQGLKVQLYAQTSNEKVGESETNGEGEFTIANFKKDLLNKYTLKVTNSKGDTVLEKTIELK